MVITAYLFNGCFRETVYVAKKSPRLETAYVAKSDAETKKLDISYTVIERTIDGKDN